MPKKKTEDPADSMASDKKSGPSAVFDVAKPGSTPATPTSRPIIVGHQSTSGKDPILTKDGPIKTDEAKSSTPLTFTREKKITPLAHDDESGQLEKEPAEPEKTAESEKASGSSDSSAAIDALAGEVDAKAQAKEQSKADIEKNEKIQALIDSKKYHLPITEGGKKAASERIVSWLLIFLLVAAAGAWIAVDAGYLDIGVELPYDFIKN